MALNELFTFLYFTLAWYLWRGVVWVWATITNCYNSRSSDETI